MTTKRTILRLINLSLIAVFFDGIIGLDIFINTTFRFAFVLSIIWVAKLVLVTPLVAVGMRQILASVLFTTISILATINTFRSLTNLNSIDALFSGIFFYLLIFFGGCAGAGWSNLTNRGNKIELSKKIANASAILLLLICSMYFLLYITHYIDYFGLGVQTYIVIAAILSQKNSFGLLIIPVIATIMTGKRGLLIVLFAQYGEKISTWRLQHGRIALAMLIISIFMIGYTSYYYDLFVRFQPIFDVSLTDIFNHDDAEAFHRLFLATSGRSNEVFAFLDAISFRELGFWIGFPVDFSFNLEDTGTGEILDHHYFHISPFNYVKHFGVVCGIYLLAIQIRVLLFAIKFGGKRYDIGLLLYVGYFFAMFFGAVVVIDILFWVSFSYSYFQWKSFRSYPAV
jgi:hypothetical protein